MHIKISKASLSEALNNVATVVSSKVALSVLQNVKIEAADGKATLTCSDLDTTLIANTECEVIESGATTIPVRPLLAAVSKAIDGTIELVVDAKDIAKMTAGTSKVNLKGLSASDFPTLTKAAGSAVRISSAAIKEMLRKTSFAMCTDETRVVLNSVFLDFTEPGSTVAVATDGKRMSMLEGQVDVPSGYNKKFILPKKAVEVLSKKLPKEGDCEIVSYGSQIRFVTPKLEFSSKLLDMEYPAYRKVIPASSKEKIVVDRVDLLGAIDRISIFSESLEMSIMNLSFADNKLVLSSGDTEFGSSIDEVPIKYMGDKIDVKFNPRYIKDALNVLDEDEVEISLTEGGPVVIRKVGSDDYTYVVMPLR